jgi:hypothetical protein
MGSNPNLPRLCIAFHKNQKNLLLKNPKNLLRKNLLPPHSEDFKVNIETIENYLIDNYYAQIQSGDMEIPKEFNFGYLEGDILYYKK